MLAAPAPFSGSQVQSRTRRSVWIACGSPFDAERARRTLERHYDAQLVTDGAALLDEIVRGAPPDVLVLDWAIGGIPAIETCHALRSSSTAARHVSILLLTTHPGHVAQGIAAGASDYLSKPYAAEELLARVAALLRARVLLERVARAEENVRRLLASAPDALLAVDAQGKVAYVNEEAERQFGAPASTLLGRPLAALLPELDLSSTAGVGDESVATLPDMAIGDAVYAPTIRALPRDFAATHTIALRDVTQRRRVEAHRRDRCSMIAHDLRLPLAEMLVRTDLLQRGARGPLPEAALADLREIARSMQSLLGQIDGFLDLSHLESAADRLRRSPVDLRLVIRRAVEEMEPLADKAGIDLTMLCDEGDATVHGDRRRLAQVMSKLLANALELTPAGGRVTVRLSGRGDEMEVRVDYSGRGIDPAELATRSSSCQRIADREHRAPGTELGLMMVREIAEAHGGTVRGDSRPGEGSTVWLRLPHRRRAILAGVHRPILLVDDDPAIRESMRFVFEAEGYTVAEVENGEQALGVMTQRPPAAAVVDLAMPVMDGWELIERMRRSVALAGIPVCVVSARSCHAPGGVARVLSKPIAVEALLDFARTYCPTPEAPPAMTTEGDGMGVPMR